MMAGSLSHDHTLESNSPRLRSSVACNDPTSEDEEGYPHDYDHGEGGSEDSWDGKRDNKDSLLLATAMMQGSEAPGEFTPSEGASDGMLPRDMQRKTAYYDYAAEKQMSQADSKLFYQQSQMEAQKTGGSNWGSQYSPQGSPVTTGMRSFSNMGNLNNAEQTYFRRSGSMRSMQSGQSSSQLAAKSRSTYPTGLASLDKPPEANVTQGFGNGGLDSQGSMSHHSESLLRAEETARVHVTHPGLPSELEPFLAQEDQHNAEVGIGFANTDAHITAELSTIYSNVQKVLDIRHKYMRLSLQGPSDNPKDDPSWNIYPPHPEPVWDEGRGRAGTMTNYDNTANDSLANSMILPSELPHTRGSDHNRPLSSVGSAPQAPQTPKASRHKRKLGQDIGSDFDMSDLEPLPEADEMIFRLDENSIYQIYENEHDIPVINIPDIRDFYMDLETILNISSDGPSKSFAFRRLQYLEGKFNLYVLLNEYQEIADSKRVPHRDFYNVRKVDTHVHHSACMNQKHLLRFIKSKMKKCPDEVVLFRDGKNLTLEEVFQSINLTAYDLSIDTLDMHAHTDSFHRFDKFNLKYNPMGESRLRTIFLKTDNFINGRYLAEITKEVISDLESSKYQMVEWRISIYGRAIDEWDRLAAWVVENKLFSPNVRWLVQIPRLFDVYKVTGLMENFEQVIVNVFQPLFEVTKDPTSHPKLHVFLQRVIGFDSVDDESKVERRLFKKFPVAKAWDSKQNPPYSYWIYYLFANITSLNVWRKQRGFNTFLLRPHCGEAGDTDHLAAAVLCCHSISHGLLLRKVPLLQYIFYLEQIGVAMSPLSNNALFLAYERNPFLQYFKRGLNVSLSTDDPLQFAFTKEPLIEEYSVAAQIYKLSAVDMCELAKNSVKQSGFEYALKQRWLGPDFHHPGVKGNTMVKSNVPNIRESFRHETLLQELALIYRYTSTATPTTVDERQIVTEQPPHQQSPASPTSSMKTNTSISVATYDSHHPPYLKSAQAARLPPSHSQVDMTAQNTGGQQTSRDSVATSPRLAALTKEPSFPIEGFRDLHVSGSEPRIFPGVVSWTQRRNSLAKERRNSISEIDEFVWGSKKVHRGTGKMAGDDTVTEGRLEGSRREMEEAGEDG